MFVVQLPPDFDRAVDRGESPSVLIDADATDPTAIGNAVAALGQVVHRSQPRPAADPADAAATPPFQFVVHARYNPEQLTVLNVVPGLVCIVLMFSTLFVTTLAITKERERGTMENLLAMPVRPIEVMIAKIAPYVVIGYIQVLLDPGRGVDLLRAPDSRIGPRSCSARWGFSSPAISRSASPSRRCRPIRCRPCSSRSSR